MPLLGPSSEEAPGIESRTLNRSDRKEPFCHQAYRISRRAYDTSVPMALLVGPPSGDSVLGILKPTHGIDVRTALTCNQLRAKIADPCWL